MTNDGFRVDWASKAPRFSGFGITPQGASFHLPGRRADSGQPVSVSVEYHHGDPSSTLVQPMNWDDQRGQWVTPSDRFVKTDKPIHYRFVVEKNTGTVSPDRQWVWDETVTNDSTAPNTPTNKRFNWIPKDAKPHSSAGPILLSFPDSMVTPEQLAAHNEARRNGDVTRGKRTHFNNLGGSSAARPVMTSIMQLMGLRGREDRPVIGGDGMAVTYPGVFEGSSHGYWTSSLFQPNRRLRNEADFTAEAMDALKLGGRWTFDGAFVNEGLNGIHVLTNLRWGDQSPYIDWFDYGSYRQFPNEPIKLGILPVKANKVTGLEDVDPAAWDMRIMPGKTKSDPYWVQLFDPRFETVDGRKIDNPAVGLLTHSQQSVQPLWFPVDAYDAQDKLDQIRLLHERVLSPEEMQRQDRQLKATWPSFQLAPRVLDNSAVKWDGQIDVAKMKVHHPQVAQMIRDGCWYWTDKTDRLYTLETAKALVSTGLTLSNAEAATEAVERITKRHLDDTTGLLPALRGGEQSPVNKMTVSDALAKSAQARQGVPTDTTAANIVAADIQQSFHLGTLPAHPLMQGLLNHPELKPQLIEPKHHWILRMIGGVIAPILHPIHALIKWISPKSKPERWLAPTGFITTLEAKLDTTFKTMSAASQAKLRDPQLAHLFYEPVARSITLALLTGKPVQPGVEPDLAATFDAMSATIPQYIQAAPPNLAAEYLSKWLQKRLKTLDLAPVAHYMQAQLATVNSDAVAVARHALHQRELGLHWRIDALKDLGDMDRVRSAPDVLKTKTLREELGRVNTLMAHVAGGIRQAFPSSDITPEITGLHTLVTDGPWDTYKKPLVNELMQEMFATGIYTSMPSMNWFYEAGHMAVAGARKPDGEANAQVTPATFLSERIKPMMAAVPLQHAMRYENMTSSHDYSTSMYGLMIHGLYGRFDHLPWHKLAGVGQDRTVLRGALEEVTYKKQLALAPFMTPDILEAVIKVAERPDVRAGFSPDVKHFLDDASHQGKAAYQVPVPVGVKAQFVEELFQRIAPADVGLSGPQLKQLKTGLTRVITEPSEAKAMRGLLSNTVFSMAKAMIRPNESTETQALATAVTGALGMSQEQARDVIKTLYQNVDKTAFEFVNGAFDNARDKRWVGHQQVDWVIDWVVDRIPADKVALTKPQRDKLKQVMYNYAVAPALEQFKRITALQIATPGNPTFYLPDLLGQAGGEDIKNMYLGCRELIRHDWLKTNPLIQGYVNDLAGLIRLRQDHHVLNNGSMVLPLNPGVDPDAQAKLEASPVVPMIRDNGHDQVISLVNLGNATNVWGSLDAARKTQRYPEVVSQQRTVTDYKLDLSHLKIQPGTVYEAIDPETPKETTNGNRYFRVNNNYQLVLMDSQDVSGLGVGINVNIARFLRRLTKDEAARLPRATS